MGRVPASENKLAWKISGPGVSRRFYYEISLEDLFVLIYGELEKIIIYTYQSRMKKLINEP